nr:oligosaccharide flippase family protein [Neoroseomonas alba]
MIVARLIAPDAFGAFAIAFSIVGFATALRDMGINNYLIQHPDPKPADLRASLFVTCSMAWGLGLLMLALSPLIGDWYGAEVRNLVYVMLLSFVLVPFGSTAFAMLQRELDFAALLRINLAGTVTNAGLSILLAGMGWDAMALATASVAGQLVTVLFAIAQRPRIDYVSFSIAGVGRVFRFGALVALSALLQQFSTNIAMLITGRFVSLQDIGLLARAQSVTGLFSRLIMDAVQPLMLPVLSAMRRDGIDLAAPLARGLSYLSVVSWPFFLFVALHAEGIIVVLFGARWVDAAILLRIMSFSGLFWIVQPIANPLLIAAGRVAVTARVQAINQVLALAGVLLAAPLGIVAVAMAGIVISALHGAVWLFHTQRAVRLTSAGFRDAFGRSALVAVLAIALPAMAAEFLPRPGPLAALILDGALLAGAWLGAVFALRHPIAAEVSMLVQLLRRRWSALIAASRNPGEASGAHGTDRSRRP